MSAPAPEGEASRPLIRAVIRTVLASLWFALMFVVAIPAGLLRLAGEDLVPPPGASAIAGLALIALVNAVLVVQIAAVVRRGGASHAPFDPPRRLVVGGLYRRSRNPMYLLYASTLLGEAILYRSATLLIYAAAFWLLAHVYVTRVEEKQLRARFGADYEAYSRRIPRWL